MFGMYGIVVLWAVLVPTMVLALALPYRRSAPAVVDRWVSRWPAWLRGLLMGRPSPQRPRFALIRDWLPDARERRKAEGIVGERSVTQQQLDLLSDASRWIVIARDSSLISGLLAVDGWQFLARWPASRPWTDDYSTC